MESKMRELFIEELAEVTGGARGGVPGRPPDATTMACCEEGPGGCCGTDPEPVPI